MDGALEPCCGVLIVNYCSHVSFRSRLATSTAAHSLPIPDGADGIRLRTWTRTWILKSWMTPLYQSIQSAFALDSVLQTTPTRMRIQFSGALYDCTIRFDFDSTSLYGPRSFRSSASCVERSSTQTERQWYQWEAGLKTWLFELAYSLRAALRTLFKKKKKISLGPLRGRSSPYAGLSDLARVVTSN